MNPNQLIISTRNHVQKLFSGEGTGHDWWHINRVAEVAKYIGEREGADRVVVELAALLHDIADHKFHGGDDTVGPREAEKWLLENGADQELALKVKQIVKEVSFKGAGVVDNPSTLEAKVVQDADRIDALGAIGIARTFAYGGAVKQEIYNPEIPPVLHDSFEGYSKSAAPTINHFYEKLLLLKDRMKTDTGRVLAQERHDFMNQFLDTFYKEWNFESKLEEA